MKKLLITIIALALALVPLTLTKAADFRSSNDQNLTVDATESPKDLYLTGQSITVNSPVKGDLVIGGGTIVINGNVEDSLFIGGGTINVRGNVGRHARIAGGTITLSGKIGGDVFVAGGTITLDSTAVVEGGLYVAGGSVVLDGQVKGEVRASTGTLTISGQTGSVKSWGSTITVNKGATITGDLVYHAPTAASIKDGATITGKTTFTKTTNNQSQFKNFFTLFTLLVLLGSILLGWLLFYFMPKHIKEVVENGLTKSAASLGYGILTLILTPMFGVILAITLVGLPITMVLMTAWFLALMIGSIVGKVIFGAAIYRLFNKQKSVAINFGVIVLGVLGLALIGFIPFIGSLVNFIFFAIGAGAVAQNAVSNFKPSNSK